MIGARRIGAPGRSKLDPIENIRKEADLVDRSGSTLCLVVLQEKDIFPIGDILKIEIKGLAELAPAAVNTVPEFRIQPEIRIKLL